MPRQQPPVRISGNKRLRNVCAAVVLGCCGASPGEYTTARLVFTSREMRCPQRRGQVVWVWVWVWVRARALTLLAGEAPVSAARCAPDSVLSAVFQTATG